jgi:hypothetical protein
MSMHTLAHAVGAVMYTFKDWYTTPWEKIDTDFLMEETKVSRALSRCVRCFLLCCLLSVAHRSLRK